ncbi:DUF805 domain-containing protein [Haematospirillum jordaniae]|uniref:DUF805 domain-containing protein n=1 Tax=Haematospirillum jordaniae TaxID=1549855 RepID=A0A143DBN8_9PROT|nr:MULTISPECIES: DUF805 domain-containing protein [Haematospirillum]AMW33940.1 hypothetical protein AY555_00725 [Haematospirillum jordaniae]NKD44416.1 DUF805 domain-containing protein [Haematospirillum jordaniae]NKD57436.1 DUF805 domain-containing protein [Haematospirillum jordaniae]NKD59866.1 DUF805 domain-containing protein [Haematospirillum jordaniae]NKD67733.1 DUF805 domain-containing protein [Haematospirillum jordaniae]
MSKPVMSSLFSASGRRNRKSYLLFLLTLIFCYIVSSILIFAVQDPLAMSLAIVLIVVTSISHCFVQAQRCRDFGWTGWSVLIGLIPFVGVIFAFAVLFIPGTDGDNRYGPDPLACAGA